MAKFIKIWTSDTLVLLLNKDLIESFRIWDDAGSADIIIGKYMYTISTDIENENYVVDETSSIPDEINGATSISRTDLESGEEYIIY